MTIKIGYTLFRPGQEPIRGEAEFDGLNYSAIKLAVTPLIDGGRLEHVAVLHDDKRADMFVDEDFIKKGLPFNGEASEIYRNASMKRNPGQDPRDLPPICGPAVLFDQRIWF